MFEPHQNCFVSLGKMHYLPIVLVKHTQEVMYLSQHDWKIDDWDIKPQNKHMSRLMGKPTICKGENKDADQLRGNREADQRLCFRYSHSTIPLLLKSKISRF